MLEIKPNKLKPFCEVAVPGSKSYTHRILIAAALSDGVCRIDNALSSEDTLLTAGALRQLGIRIEQSGDRFVVSGGSGCLRPVAERIYLGNSGTSMRLLTAVAALAEGNVALYGSERMGRRPIRDLLDALGQIGIRVVSLNGNGCPPVEVWGGTVSGGAVAVNCGTSSQYLSALLLMAPYTLQGLDISVAKGMVSKPYVDMTVHVMSDFGVPVERRDYQHFRVAGGRCYRAGDHRVEPDSSQAGYFWAAAAVCGVAIKVRGICEGTRQGDARFAQVLEAMGCKRIPEPDGLTVCGGRLHAAEIDMADMPDMVPTLAVVAAFAAGTTIIRNVSHLKAKESDRLAAVVNELVKMGIDARCSDDALIVTGGRAHGAEIETYDDHRIAMSFAVAGLAAPGTAIRDEGCVAKSFPEFWEIFEGLYAD